MNDPRDHVPVYQMIRVSAPQTPDAVAADAQAWRARENYPRLCFAGPVFGVVREREEGGWEVVTSLSALAPQDARDSMGGPSQPGDAADPVTGVVIDPVTDTGMSEAILKVELLNSIYPSSMVPAEVHDDAVRAAHTHPGGVLLPAAFTLAEQVAGDWHPVDHGTSAAGYGPNAAFKRPRLRQRPRRAHRA